MNQNLDLHVTAARPPWNKGKLIGAKPPLRSKTCMVDPHKTAVGWPYT